MSTATMTETEAVIPFNLPQLRPGVFTFHDGARQRLADPDPLRRRLLKCLAGASLDTLWATAQGQALPGQEPPTPEQQESATTELVQLARATLNVEVLGDGTGSGQGMTEAELLEAFGGFLLFLHERDQAAATAATEAKPKPSKKKSGKQARAK